MKTLKTITLALLVALTISSAFSQAENGYSLAESKIVEKTKSPKTLNPSYIGGNEALAEFLSTNLEYPEIAKRQGVEGTVILTYTITKKGEITDIKVAQSVNKELDKEAIRLVSKMPKWSPAVKDGKARDIKYQLPVKFELNF